MIGTIASYRFNAANNSELPFLLSITPRITPESEPEEMTCEEALKSLEDNIYKFDVLQLRHMDLQDPVTGAWAHPEAHGTSVLAYIRLRQLRLQLIENALKFIDLKCDEGQLTPDQTKLIERAKKILEEAAQQDQEAEKQRALQAASNQNPELFERVQQGLALMGIALIALPLALIYMVLEFFGFQREGAI
jgi:hypothetical protein